MTKNITDDNICNKLISENFNVQLRYTMECDLNKKIPKTQLQSRFNFCYDLKSQGSTIHHIEKNAYAGSIDIKLFPEIVQQKSAKEIKNIEEKLSPLIYENKNIVASSFVYSIDKDKIGIGSLSVIKTHQNQGLGKGILQEILFNTQKKGFKKVELTVTANNTRAVKLYEALAFKITDKFFVITKNY